MGGKTLKTILILSGIGLIGYAIYYYFVQQSSLLKQLTISPQSVVLVGDITKSSVPLEVNLAITNPSNIPITVDSIVINIYANGILLGTAMSPSSFIIPSMNLDGSPGVNVGTLKVDINPSRLLNVGSIISIATLKGVNVVVNGYANISATPAHLQIPINFTQSLTF